MAEEKENTFADFNAPKGYEWTDKWTEHERGYDPDDWLSKPLKGPTGEMVGSISKLGPMIGTGGVQQSFPDPYEDWDFDNQPPDPENPSRTLNHFGESLPQRAEKWDPEGNAYYGEDFGAGWRKALDTVDESKENRFGWEREPDDDGDTYDKWYQKIFQSQWGKYSAGKTSLRAGIQHAMGMSQWLVRQAIERPLGTASLAFEEIATETMAPVEERVQQIEDETGKSVPMPGDIQEGLLRAGEAVFAGPVAAITPKADKEWLTDVIERMNPARNLVNTAVTFMALAAGKTSLEEIGAAFKNNWDASRMAYSIGAGELILVEQFNHRVYVNGEDPAFVAMDMEQFGSELVGQVIGDPLNLLDLWMKPASQGNRIANVIHDILAPADEFVEIFSKGDEVISGAQAIDKADDILDAYQMAASRKSTVITDLGQKFGLISKQPRQGIIRSKFPWWKNTWNLTRTGASKRNLAAKSANHFVADLARVVGYNNPDELAKVVQHIANLGSADRELAMDALHYLADLPGYDLRRAMSEGGLEFGVIIRNMLDNGEGVYEAKTLLSGLKKVLKDGGEVDQVIAYVNRTVGKVLNDLYPTMDELIDGKKLFEAGMLDDLSPGVVGFFESGGKIRPIDRIMNAGITHPGLLGLQRNVAGRVFIGSNPQVAFRGAVYDALLTTMEMGPDVMMKNPKTWSELSVTWLGMEHYGLTQGFSKADIAGMDKWAKQFSSYEDMPGLLGAVFNTKGKVVATAADVGMKPSVFDTATNVGGRLLQHFEVQNSQRIIGKAVPDAMTHLIQTVMPKIDELLQAGLPANIADSLGQRIINSFGDVEKAQASLIDEVIRFGSVDKLREMSWLDDSLRGLFSEFNDINTWDNITSIIQNSEGQTLGEIVELITKEQDSFFKVVRESAATQHAQPNLHNDEVVEAIAGFIEEAKMEGTSIPAQFADEVMDIVQANVNTKNSVVEAITDIGTSIGDKIRANAIEQGISLEEIDPILKFVNDQFKGAAGKVTSRFAKTTGESSVITQQVRALSQRLIDDTDKLADIKKDIKALLPNLDVSNIRTRGDVKNSMWVYWFSEKRKDFSIARESVVGMSGELLESLRGTVPDEILEAIQNGPYVKAIQENNNIAIAIEQSIMIDGKMKPVGMLVKDLTDFGQKDDALRALLTYMNPNFKYSDSGADTRLLQIVNNYIDGGFNSLDDISVEQAWDALSVWRDEANLPKKVDFLGDLVGYEKAAEEVVTGATKITDELLGIGDSTAPTKLYRGAQQVEPGAVTGAEGFEGVYATWDPTEANIYAADRAGDIVEGSVVTPVTMDIQNPYMSDIPIDNLWSEEGQTLIKMLEDQGYDGIVDIDGKQVVAFSKEQVKIGYSAEEIVEKTISVMPPTDGASPSWTVHAQQSRERINTAFDSLINGVQENFGVREVVPSDQGVLDGINTWFKQAGTYVENHRMTAAQYAQEMRDFILHDYADRFGVDAILSLGYNFHFWPTRTMAKWGQRIPSNMGVINKYATLRRNLERLHADQPEWMRTGINTNELLGLHSPNPITFYLENTLNPFQDIAGGFDDPDRRKNWYSTLIDGLGNTGTGSPSLIFQMAAVLGLKLEGEDEAAAKFGGRLIPLTRQIKGATALLGINEGRGVELDPMIRWLSEAGFFSSGGRAMGPYEQDRVAMAANQVLIDNPGVPEQVMEDFWNHEGPLWDEAIRVARQATAGGELASFFTGLSASSKGADQPIINDFWTDYIGLVSQYETLSSDVYRKEYSDLMQEYPFAPYMLLSRRGSDERDRSYAYMVLSRIEPGRTDNFSKAVGFDYDIVGYFYDEKGDLTKLNEKDRVKFMTFISELGATLAIPDNATKSEWSEASYRYSTLREMAEEFYGDDIWDRVDQGYTLRGAGLNQSLAWQDYLEENPDVEAVMQWQSEQIFMDPILKEYYGSIAKLRDYGTGRMYQMLEDEFGSEIFDKDDIYGALVRSGQKDEAKEYKKNNLDLKRYYDRRDVLKEDVKDAIVEYGEKLTDGESTRLRDDLPEDISEGESDIIDYYNEPDPKKYSDKEWRELIGKEAVGNALLVWDGQPISNKDEEDLKKLAEEYDLTYDEFILSIGASGY